MSEQGFKGVPGVPEGWELLEFRTAVSGDCVIDVRGCVMTWGGKESVYVYPIIREVETPKKYRPFANAAEFLAHPLHAGFVDLGAGKYGRVQSFDDDFVSTVVSNNEEYLWDDAFVDLNFHDGTPFGVEVIE
jgi:hypothetical protein